MAPWLLRCANVLPVSLITLRFKLKQFEVPFHSQPHAWKQINKKDLPLALAHEPAVINPGSQWTPRLEAFIPPTTPQS